MKDFPPFKRTRLAPTPSGYLHLGNVLSFAVTAELARRSGASILLRIDDLDRQRAQPAYVQDIFDTLHFLDIPWDEGPRDFQEFEREYSQVHRMEMYKAAMEELVDKEAVFACNCSRSQLAAGNGGEKYPGTCLVKSIALNTPNVNWRPYTTPDRPLRMKTWPYHSVEAVLPPEMQYFVVRKKDGFPAYQLSSVVDDRHFGVDLVVRGADLWASTLAQLYLASILQEDAFLQTTFYHHPLLMKAGEVKLSKSASDTSIQYFRAAGKRPADVYTMIGRMLHHEGQLNNWQELGALVLESAE